MLLFILWALGTLVSLAAFGYLKGHADARFRDNPGVTENPPFILGMLTSPFWPAQIFAALIWGVCHVSYRSGKGDGMAINTELHELRKFAGEYKKEEARTFKFLIERNIDPLAIDDNTKRALTARSIEWAMEDEATIRREAAGLPVLRKEGKKSLNETKTSVPLADSLFEILDQKGVRVESDDYDDYWTRTKGPLDL